MILECRISFFRVCSQWDYILKILKNCLRYMVDQTPYVNLLSKDAMLDASDLVPAKPG
jgi:hypothetical protein